MTDLELGKKIAAKEILNIIEKICFSKEYIEYRVNNGSRGTRDLIISFIKNKYDIK